ncbi:MAG: DUF1792 domain-containing protein [Clostridiales bacterium]|nr:DUF1792 domain-containing protein [Clostridiales bacterium]
MKKTVKKILAEIVYYLYKKKILKNKIKLMSLDETLDALLATEKSLVRFGDGEIVILKGVDLELQKADLEITENLIRILGYEYENLMVALPGIFDGVEKYQEKSRLFWKDHLLFCRNIYNRYCSKEKLYGDAMVSRCYYLFKEKSQCGGWFDKFKLVWKDKDIVVVEGERTHNGVGNDLFEHARSVERIICPPSNAYDVYDRILEECGKVSKDKLFLISLGVTAKMLTEALFLQGYRVLDIGNLDMEYEWYLSKAQSKTEIGKHKIIGLEANEEAGYSEYLQQIIARIGPEDSHETSR